jgi:DNA-directed RNA polymerase specialized sigma subunit
MTVSEIKEHLEQGHIWARDIRIKRERIKQLKRSADTEDQVRECEREIVEDIHQIERIKGMVYSIGKMKYRHVLELYYLDGLTWAEVAFTLGFSLRHVQRLRLRALEELCGQLV